jgi:AAA+ superfamily predicted ATPase
MDLSYGRRNAGRSAILGPVTDNPLLDSLRRAVAALPDDVGLRLSLAEQLAAAGEQQPAIAELAGVLQRDPGNQGAVTLLVRLTAPSSPLPAAVPEAAVGPLSDDEAPEAVPQQEASVPDPDPDADPDPADDSVNWSRLEADLGDIVSPMFVDDAAADEPAEPAYEREVSTTRLADVGGMREVKARLESAFLAPMRNADLRRLYGKSLRGGMLLYGPPGCGKTFLGRAVAGELGASFISVGLSDVLDMYIGNSERNLHELFELARRSVPSVLFFDEVDALGQKRSQTRNSATRGTINQMLSEMDGVNADNEGVFIIGATNQPWDIDTALRRPGRLDRTLLVLPPDAEARAAIFKVHLRDRPVEGISVDRLAKATDGYSGADIAHICETAAERALMDSVQTGVPRMISMADLQAAAAEVRASTGPWFSTARNVVMFGDPDGQYDELRVYMKKHRML